TTLSISGYADVVVTYLSISFLPVRVLSATLFFFFIDAAPPEIYTLSLHDALPISRARSGRRAARPSAARGSPRARCASPGRRSGDRKSTRLNSSHVAISYAVFCLKKKKCQRDHRRRLRHQDAA